MEKSGLCVAMWLSLQRQKEDRRVFNNTGFGGVNTEKPCGCNGASLWKPWGSTPYWLVYEERPKICFMALSSNQVNTILIDSSNWNHTYLTFIVTPWWPHPGPLHLKSLIQHCWNRCSWCGMTVICLDNSHIKGRKVSCIRSIICTLWPGGRAATELSSLGLNLISNQ